MAMEFVSGGFERELPVDFDLLPLVFVDQCHAFLCQLLTRGDATG
jgi:hypothetical protein